MFHVIDDEAMLREMLGTLISDVGYGVLCFESSEKYIEYLNSPEFENPICVLSDVTMPGMYGDKLVCEIRKVHPYQKIILVTGNVDDKQHQDVASQLCYTLYKPFNIEKMLGLLVSLVNCEAAKRNSDKHAYLKRCEFGIDHHCPFHQAH